MGLIHILAYVFVFTLGGAAAVDLVRIAVKMAARRWTSRQLVDPARLRLDVERAPFLGAAKREVDEMFWETSSLDKSPEGITAGCNDCPNCVCTCPDCTAFRGKVKTRSEAARIEHGAVTGCSNPACLGGHAPNEAAVPEPRELDLTGFVSTVTIVGADGTLVKLPDAGGPVIIDGHTLPSSDDERWELSGKDRIWFWFRTEGFGLAVYDDGRVWLDSKEWFVHKDAAALFRKVRDRIGPIQKANDEAQKAKAVAAVEAAARKRP